MKKFRSVQQQLQSIKMLVDASELKCFSFSLVHNSIFANGRHSFIYIYIYISKYVFVCYIIFVSFHEHKILFLAQAEKSTESQIQFVNQVMGWQFVCTY